MCFSSIAQRAAGPLCFSIVDPVGFLPIAVEPAKLFSTPTVCNDDPKRNYNCEPLSTFDAVLPKKERCELCLKSRLKTLHS